VIWECSIFETEFKFEQISYKRSESKFQSRVAFNLQRCYIFFMMENDAFVDRKKIYKELKAEIYNFLAERNIPARQSKRMVIQGLVLFLSWAVCYSAFLYWGQQSDILALLLSLPWAFVMLMIQLAVMHDGSHGASSESATMNKLLTSAISFIGGSALLWESQHCHAHHSFTNVHKKDHDIDTGGLLRLHSSQELRSHHQYQHIYAWMLYPLFVLSWIWWGDLRDIIKNTYSIGPQRMRRVIVEFVIIKVWHVFLFLILPALVFKSFALALICYLISFSLLGFFMVIIFQLAHMTGVQSLPENEKALGDDFTLRQVLTTVNFATDNRFLTWVIGGLNFQIEHHLFPQMSHVNYPVIQPLVVAFCQKKGIPYFNYPNVMEAVSGHQNHLRQMGCAPLS